MSDRSEVSPQDSPESGSDQPKTVINLPDGAIIVERSNIEERQLLQRIAETLELLTARLGVKPQGQIPSYVITDQVPLAPGREAHELITTHIKHRHINWMHLINFVFVVIMAIALILPQLLSTAFGMTFHPSLVSHPEISINPGDILVTKSTPVSAISPKDLILITNDMTWDLDAHSVYAVSKADSAGMITLTESASGTVEPGEQYTLASSTRIHKITNVIPRVNNLAITTHIIYLKIALVLLVLLLNIVVFFVRRRRSHAGWE